jgi:hypothetical protein
VHEHLGAHHITGGRIVVHFGADSADNLVPQEPKLRHHVHRGKPLFEADGGVLTRGVKHRGVQQRAI